MTLLFAHGGDDHARTVFARERRGYWSAAFPVMLEKYGYLDAESIAVASAEELVDRVSGPHAPAVLLVSRLPASAWSAGALRALSETGVPALIEGPVDRAIAAELGIRTRSRSCEDGTLEVLQDGAAALGRGTTGFPASGPIARPAHRVVPRDAAFDWPRQPEIPLEGDQAAAWRAPGWDIERWTVPDDLEVVARWTPWETPENACPAIVRSGSLLLCSGSLLAYLGQMHTSEPFDGGEYRAARRVTGVESAVLGLIDWMHSWTGRARARVLPWPLPARWARSVRHDFDRPLAPAAVQQVLDRHAQVGSRATWYWRSDPRPGRAATPPGELDLSPAALVAASEGHEVGVHTEMIWAGASAERAAVEQAAGAPVRGATAHGSAAAFRYQGAPNLLWAEAEGLAYSELLQHAHLHPHAFPVLERDGTLRSADVLCLPRHVSFDVSVREGDVQPAAVLAAVPLFMRSGGLMQVMNHPDVHGDRLFGMLAEMPAEERIDLTAGDAMEWWARTHRADRLGVRLAPDGTLTVVAADDVEDVGIEILRPDGSRSVERLSVAGGREAAART